MIFDENFTLLPCGIIQPFQAYQYKCQTILNPSVGHSSILNVNYLMFFLQFVRKLCPHHIGHHLGMDVHDNGSVGKNLPLSEGMVITIEPGLYVRDEMDVPTRWINLRLCCQYTKCRTRGT